MISFLAKRQFKIASWTRMCRPQVQNIPLLQIVKQGHLKYFYDGKCPWKSFRWHVSVDRLLVLLPSSPADQRQEGLILMDIWWGLCSDSLLAHYGCWNSSLCSTHKDVLWVSAQIFPAEHGAVIAPDWQDRELLLQSCQWLRSCVTGFLK